MGSTTEGIAAMGNGLITVLNNVGMEASSFMTVVRAFAYVAGLVFLTFGIVMMRDGVNPSARTSHKGSGWFWSISIGVLLFALPTTIAALGGSLFGGLADTSPMAYAKVIDGQFSQGSCKLSGIRPLLALIGVIAIIRGLIVFRAVGMYGSRDKSTFSRGAVLCISGVMLVHMQETIGLLNGVTGLKLGAGLC